MRPYRTIGHASEAEFTEKRSRFIGRCFPVQSEAEAQEILVAIRKKHYDATHNCYAYIVGEDGLTARYSDDGEPQGTAGQPMLEVLKAKGITNVLCIATRYFGGILLGAGGLVRAYARSAADACSAAGLIEYICAVSFDVNIDYSRYGAIEGFVRSTAQVDAVNFTDSVTMSVSLEESKADEFRAQLTEKTDGRVRITPTGSGYLCREVKSST